VAATATTEADVDELTDASVELANGLEVQIADYPRRDGGLQYFVHRFENKDTSEMVMIDVGSAKTVEVLVALLKAPVAA
jgi:hypothetical protein